MAGLAGCGEQRDVSPAAEQVDTVVASNAPSLKVELHALRDSAGLARPVLPDFSQAVVPPERTNVVFELPKINVPKINVPKVDAVKDDLSGNRERWGDCWSGGKGYLVGTFYDLKQRPSRRPVSMSDERYGAVIRKFVDSRWNEKILKAYFQAPGKKYPISLVIPVLTANETADAFMVSDRVRPCYWLIHYKGQIVVPETGRYRFCGTGDDVLLVRIGRKIVLDASQSLQGVISDWESPDRNSGKYPLANGVMTIGDWFNVRKGDVLPMEVLVGEGGGSFFCCQLLVEQEGARYRQVEFSGGARPVLPIFKMAPVPKQMKEKMELNPDEATFDGPTSGGAR